MDLLFYILQKKKMALKIKTKLAVQTGLKMVSLFSLLLFVITHVTNSQGVVLCISQLRNALDDHLSRPFLNVA